MKKALRILGYTLLAIVIIETHFLYVNDFNEASYKAIEIIGDKNKNIMYLAGIKNLKTVQFFDPEHSKNAISRLAKFFK